MNLNLQNLPVEMTERGREIRKMFQVELSAETSMNLVELEQRLIDKMPELGSYLGSTPKPKEEDL